MQLQPLKPKDQGNFICKEIQKDLANIAKSPNPPKDLMGLLNHIFFDDLPDRDTEDYGYSRMDLLQYLTEYPPTFTPEPTPIRSSLPEIMNDNLIEDKRQAGVNYLEKLIPEPYGTSGTSLDTLTVLASCYTYMANAVLDEILRRRDLKQQ